MNFKKLLLEADGTVTTTDPDKAEKLAKKGVDVKLTDDLSEENETIEELEALAEEIAISLIKALESIGDEVITSAVEIEDGEMFIDVLFADNQEAYYQFFVEEDKIYLHKKNSDIELVDFGITPGGKIVLNNELLTDKLTTIIKQEISEKKAKKDYDGDGKIETPEQEYKGSRSKAIKKAMKEEESEIELVQDPKTKEFSRRMKLSDKDKELLKKIQALLDKEKESKTEQKSDYQKRREAEADYKTAKKDVPPRPFKEPKNDYFARRKKELEYKYGFAGQEMGEDLDVGHQDDEPDMIKQEVYEIAEYASKLYKLLHKLDQLDVEVDFPHWWQSKITKARMHIGKATHYLAFEMKQGALDAMTLDEESDTITLQYDEFNNTITFSDKGKIKVDYDGDFKYRGKFFNIDDIGSEKEMEKELEKSFPGHNFKHIKPIKNEDVNEQKATCCGRCGRVHVKGTPCKKPYISKNSPRHCQNK